MNKSESELPASIVKLTELLGEALDAGDLVQAKILQGRLRDSIGAKSDEDFRAAYKDVFPVSFDSWGEDYRMTKFSGMSACFNGYGWALGAENRIYALVAGDQGYVDTHITLEDGDLDDFFKDRFTREAVAKLGGVEAMLEKFYRGPATTRVGDVVLRIDTPWGTYLAEPDGWLSPVTGRHEGGDNPHPEGGAAGDAWHNALAAQKEIRELAMSCFRKDV